MHIRAFHIGVTPPPFPSAMGSVYLGCVFETSLQRVAPKELNFNQAYVGQRLIGGNLH